MSKARMVGAVAMAFNFCALGAFGLPETLILRNFSGTKTVEVEINYDKYPKIAPPAGWEWSDFDEDTAWTVTNPDFGEVKFVRYHRIFRARLNGVEGLGYDYIHYDGPGSGNDHYSGLFGFNFDDGAIYQAFGVDGAHYKENLKLPVPNKLVTPGTEYQFVHDSYKLPEFQYLGIDSYLLVDKHHGWGNGEGAANQVGGDIPAGRNGKIGAPPPGFFMKAR